MREPTYLRRTALDWLFIVAISAALIAGGYFAIRTAVRGIRESAVAEERAKHSAFTHAINQIAVDAWRRERDSLRLETGKRDTVIRWRIRQAAALPPADATPSDTAALRGALRLCRATIDTLATSCDEYRASASRALALSDSLRRVDSLRVIFASSSLVAATDTATRLRSSLRRAEKRPGWQGVGTGAAIGIAVGVVIRELAALFK